MPLLPRYSYNNNCDPNVDNSCYDYYNSPWSSYGRWILLAAIVVGAFLIFLVFSCFTARRRRRQGMNPYRGTGWAAGVTPAGHGPAQYTGAPAAQPYYAGNQYPNNNAAPPIYSPPPNQGIYGQNQGYGENQSYFGGQQNGVELQQPDGAYHPQRGGESVYEPPTGPPPSKKGDGIVR